MKSLELFMDEISTIYSKPGDEADRKAKRAIKKFTLDVKDTQRKKIADVYSGLTLSDIAKSKGIRNVILNVH